jgi:hypothetical protein
MRSEGKTEAAKSKKAVDESSPTLSLIDTSPQQSVVPEAIASANAYQVLSEEDMVPASSFSKARRGEAV